MKKYLVFLCILLLVFCVVGSANALSVSVFDDSSYVDTSDGPYAESDAVQAALTSLGHTVSTFTGISAAAFSGGIGGSTTLLFPELERGDLGGALGAPALGVISGFLGSGGRIVVIGSHYTVGSPRGASLVNAILGTAYGELSYSTASTSTITGAADASPFAGGPSPVTNFSGTSGLTGVAAGDTIYTSDGAASIAYFAGGGGLAYLGWDFFNAAPLGSVDGGWLSLLDDAVAGAPIPEPATMLLLGSGLIGLAGFRRKFRKS